MELSNLSQFMIELKHSGKSEYHGAYKQILYASVLFLMLV